MSPLKAHNICKKATILLLLSSLCLHSACRLGIVSYFYLNQRYIAEELCINRFEQASTCQGSCYLNKMLNEVEDEAEKVPESLLKVQEILLYYCESTPFSLLPPPVESTPLAKGSFNDCWSNRSIEGIFRPPRIS